MKTAKLDESEAVLCFSKDKSIGYSTVLVQTLSQKGYVFVTLKPKREKEFNPNVCGGNVGAR
ncbi:hypothetical protein [Prevotella ihumii]|uniref:hypothetical protein n=1 Tax=Prevotella ihumii TaxID=1917878 RepID=UPI0012B5AB7C|nr:hypothetical protein [Prevotella ihumii]